MEQTQDIIRQGASCEPPHEGEDFPMIVYLRGDEEYFNDFNMNADQVMSLLGIRRSRLNQISGRDLRVGRTRIDSYIRPVYRKEDVDQYLEWIRPTATHKKSSELLNEAREKLEQQSGVMSQQLSDRFESFVDRFLNNVERQFFDHTKHSKSLFHLLQRNVQGGVRSLLHRVSFMQEQSLKRWEYVKERLEEWAPVQEDIKDIKLMTLKLTEMARYSERMLLELQVVQKNLHELLEKHSQKVEDIEERLSVTSPLLPLHRRRRTEGFYAARRATKTKSLDPIETSIVPSWSRKRRKLM